jgi:hypothetical protein
VSLWTELYDREEARKTFAVFEDSSDREAKNRIYTQRHNSGLGANHGSAFISDSNLPALGLPPAISSPVTSIVPYTYGQAFEIQRVLDQQKRDSLYHRRQGDRLLTQNQEDDNTLVSSFASLNLESVSSQARPLVARFPCVCGRIFICQEALAKHKQEVGWWEKGKKRDKMFITPRPQYQEDEDLHVMAALLARQQYSEL